MKKNQKKKKQHKQQIPDITPDVKFSIVQSNSDKGCAFSFKYLTENKDYGLNSLSNEAKVKLVNSINSYSHKNWNEIQSTHKHINGGMETIKQDAIKVKIPNFIKEDTKLIVLRFGKKIPMVGFRDNSIFHVVWFDPKFQLYNHGRK